MQAIYANKGENHSKTIKAKISRREVDKLLELRALRWGERERERPDKQIGKFSKRWISILIFPISNFEFLRFKNFKNI